MIHVKRVVLEYLEDISKKVIQNNTYTLLSTYLNTTLLYCQPSKLFHSSSNNLAYITLPNFYLYY